MTRTCKLMLLGVCCTAGIATAQNLPVRLFPENAPGETRILTETEENSKQLNGGKTVLYIRNVSEPSITVYPAMRPTATKSAVIVCPGGAYEFLSYDSEGSEVCEWLNSLGITSVLLKYRVPRREGRAKHAAPLQDLQRAISYLRAHATEMNINPQRIGVMGFSAGAHLSAMAGNSSDERTYPAIDAADSASCRPDFCLLGYPAYLDGNNFQPAPEVKVSASTPPTMMIQAENDKYYINSSLFYYYALKEAGVPARMHLYSTGGHGFGMRKTGTAVDEWPQRAEDWFREIGALE